MDAVTTEGSQERARAPSVGQSLREYGRGIAGGLLFSLPMLYTAEIWQLGETLSPGRLLIGTLGVFALLLGYNRYAGLRRDAGLLEVVIDSIEELGLGLLLAAGLLLLLGRIDGQMTAPELLGKVLVAGLAVAIGVSIGTAQLGGGDDDSGMAGDSAGGDALSLGGQMALALCGAVLVAANIAPTDEIAELGGVLREWALLGLTALTLGVCAFVLNFGDFIHAGPAGSWRAVVSASVASYLAAIVASVALLWFVGRLDDCGPAVGLAQVVVLGLPTAVGASAGRLLLQTR